MSFSETFIKNSVGTTLLTIAITLAGIIGFRLLPVAPLPEVEFPTIQVQAQLPGASPETMASSVATPLERQFGHIADLTDMTSTSFLGQTSIVLQFGLDRNIDAAGRDVQAAINAANSYLPSNLPAKPTYRKVNPADAPIMILALTSKVKSPGEMYDSADSILEQKLSQIEGVGQVVVGGGALPAVRVELNPTQLFNEGISLEQVRSTLAAANANRPKGEFSDAEHSWSISTTDQLLKADQYKPLIVGYHNGSAVVLSDVATVEDSVQNVRASGYSNLERAVLVIIFRSPGANIINTVDNVRKALPALRASIPASINLAVAMDRTTTIRASVNDVERTLVLSVCLVVMVVFLFLRNVRATLIPGLAVPISLVGTFGLMYLFGFSIDNLSLMALTISTGFVVDDAIVVVENISRYLEEGLSPYRAAVKGCSEIAFTVVSISISLIAVFIPILLMGGIVGRLFREFAVTLAAAVAVSMVVSLTTTPMMCAKLLRAEHDREHGGFYRVSEQAFQGMLNRYEICLQWVLRHERLMLGVALLTLAFNIYLFIVIPKGFFPEQDTGRLMGAVLADQDTSFQAMNRRLQRILKIVLSDPAVDNVLAFTGGNGATNTATMYIDLKPLAERKISAQALIGRLRKKTASSAGLTLYMQAQQDLRIGGRQSNAEYQYTLQGDDLAQLMEWAPKVTAKLRTLPQLADVNSDQQNAGLAANLVLDRKTASRFGVTPQLFDDTLYDAFGQREVSTMYTPLNQYFVVMEAAPQYWQNPDGLSDVYISTNDTSPGTATIASTSSTTGGSTTASASAQASTAAGSPGSTSAASAGTSSAPTVNMVSTGNIGSGTSVVSGIGGSGAIIASSGAIGSSVTAGLSATADPEAAMISSSAVGTSVTPGLEMSISSTAAGISSTGATTATGGAPAATTTAPGQVPLAALSQYQESTTPLTVNHQGQFPAVTISFNLAPGVSLGYAVDLINAAEADIHVPAGIRGTFQGSAQAFQASLANEPMLILAALLTVYIVLGILYESYIHPITILSTLPSAGVGALLFLLLFGIDLSIIALIGIILLIGIVKKNAILMIDFALEAERKLGKSPEEAIYQACILRFRPIMMTTMAAMLGGLPLALGNGVGSELRRPLGIAIVGGLLVSQMLTLFTTPVIYVYMDSLSLWWARVRGRTPARVRLAENKA
jgi:multidrug efflux pump